MLFFQFSNMNKSEQLTELRDALKGIRYELSLKDFENYISVFLQDPELKSILIANDAIRALWYCLWNNNADRNSLINKLYNFFTAHKGEKISSNRTKDKILELISMILFLGGVDFQINEIEIDEEPCRKDTTAMAMPNQSQQAECLLSPTHKVRKISIWLICALGVIFVALISASWLRSCYKNHEVVPECNPVGTIVSTKGTNIMLMEHQQDGACSIKAVSKKNNGRFIEEKVFQTSNGKQSVISVTKDDKWLCTNPDNGFFAFNKSDSSLYVPLITRNLTYADRYTVYHFNGQCFICKSTNSAGYWLYPSLQVFDRLFVVGQTDKYLVRIDYVNNGSLRYASWNKEKDKTMKDKPDIILFNDGQIVNEKIVFRSGYYKYIFDYGENNLWVINDKNDKFGKNNQWFYKDKDIKILYCHNLEILCK